MAVSTQALLQRADLPQHIAMQIAASAQRGGADRPVDIILNPAELGRVRLSLSSTDGVMSVTVIAERPETLDLMRRHIDTLAQEFLNIGYEKAQFSFGGGHSGQTGQNDGEACFSSSGGSGQHDPMTGTPDLNHTPILISDRLDIRL
ncbi:MAG: flagellar hook-length control protein FliK [Roseovarius sp.]|nr:flagellar hook-length control protein FliK [Roseovarius sp.]